jgi:hypothetical protein
MRELAERVVSAVSDVMVGTVIVLVHAALADRERSRRYSASRNATRSASCSGEKSNPSAAS